MKIAIQGHPTRGKEVIHILKSLGGKSREELTGRRISQYYFINCNGDIDLNLKINLLNRKFYTLEEFEKEFPFKVGDKVIHKEFNDFFEVISFNPESSYPYKIKGVCEFTTKSYVLTKWQPKMKEERFVTLTLDKAKEWYKKGGELREVALQAYSEEELTKVELPKTWEEFCNNYPMKGEMSYIDDGSNIKVISFCNDDDFRDNVVDRNMCPSEKSAEAHLAMIQLEQLRDCWRQGWKPDWNDNKQTKYCIVYYKGEFSISILCETRHFLSFPTMKMAEEFLKCFRDLVKQAGDLI